MRLEHTFRLFDLASQPAGQPRGIFFSADGRLLIGRAPAHGFCVWTISRERLVFDRRWGKGSKDFIDQLTLTPDSRYLITAGTNLRDKLHDRGQITVWELLTGRLVKRWNVDGRRVTSAACDPRGTRLATIGEDGFVRLWAFPSCKEIQRVDVAGPSRRGRYFGGSVAFLGRGKDLLVTGERRLAVWHEDGSDLTGLSLPPADWFRVSASADGTKVAARIFRWSYVLGKDGKPLAPPKQTYSVRFWDTGTGKTLADWQMDREAPGWIGFHPDGRHLLGWVGADIVCWDIKSRRRVATWHIPQEVGPVETRVAQVVLSPAADRLATAHMDGTVRVWRIPSGKLP